MRSAVDAVFRVVMPFVLIGLVADVGEIRAQPTPDPTEAQDGTVQGDSLELVFEREVFNYPVFERRNPFRPLGADEASGPRFEDLVFLGAILASNPNQSIALIGARVPGATSGQPAARSYRLRVDDIVGNVRILDIRTDAVLVEVEDFGVVETRTLQRRQESPPPAAQGTGSAPPAEAPVNETPEEIEDVDSDGGSDPAGQARTDDANGERRNIIGVLAAHAENGNGGLR